MRVEEKVDNDPEESIVRLLSKANDSVLMSTILHPDFYERRTIIEAVKSVAEKVNEFYLLLDPDSDWELYRERLPWLIQLVKEGRIEIRKSDERIFHRMIVDGKHLRLEEKHGPTELKVDNVIVWDAPRLISDPVYDRFLEWWNHAHPVR